MKPIPKKINLCFFMGNIVQNTYTSRFMLTHQILKVSFKVQRIHEKVIITFTLMTRHFTCKNRSFR